MDYPEYEVRQRNNNLRQYFNSSAPDIQVAVSKQELQELFGRIQNQWSKLGESEPYWSVLTHDQYLNENLNPEILIDFYGSGEQDAELIQKAAERCGVFLRNGVCLELGCGVGRVTKHLARRFKKVIALDVSRGNLEIARQMALREGLSNIEFVAVDLPDQFSSFGKFDFFYSVIALQHNPPPIQHFMIDCIMKKLNRGGGFLFQTQTYKSDYHFTVGGYLGHSADLMDMHSLPMSDVLSILNKRRCVVKEVMEDFWTGRFGSHTFFGVRA